MYRANPVPGPTSRSPSSATVGGAGFTLTVSGSHFVNGSQIRWNGAARATTFVKTAAAPSHHPRQRHRGDGHGQRYGRQPGAGGWDVQRAAVHNVSRQGAHKTKLIFGAVTSGTALLFKTSNQTVRLTQGSGTVTWTVTSNQPWLQVSPASGSGSAAVDQRRRRRTAVPGALTA